MILVTGGAGFIGSHLVRSLVAAGNRVRVVDALVPQVHGEHAIYESGLPQGVMEFQRGDVHDAETWRKGLRGCDAVVHLAAEVGVGQSMYEITRYMAANTMGTSVMLQHLADERPPLRRLVVASSMSIYGEGAYQCEGCGPQSPAMRPVERLAAHRWEVACPKCGADLRPVPTPEGKPLQPTSVYAISKRDQEELCLNVGRAYGIPTVALRFFNAYGPGQALSNPYTGLAAIFAARLLNAKPPLLFEDGEQARDFIHVSVVVRAIERALEEPGGVGEAFNVGSGIPRTVRDVAADLAAALGVDIVPEQMDEYHEGDIRHCYADIGKAAALLGFVPRAAFAERVGELADWVRGQVPVDWVAGARSELERRGLTR